MHPHEYSLSELANGCLDSCPTHGIWFEVKPQGTGYNFHLVGISQDV